ncbi:hypothetical protein GX51_01720 [Blastomyces parvus]|uniref:Uncharacterized protein n=1 Tax=Blastomyces parvus TaxID=2060905 RepID=A0A2B7XF86_9EURO|nr:hypothetical protein GX51_01720 [Blastomyces parvus]
MPAGHASLLRGPEGTIYEASVFDDNFRIEIDPTKIKFIKELKTSEASSIFHFHNNEDPGYADDGVRDLNRACCEIRAYCALKCAGICDEGYVLQFYGYTFTLDPTVFAPHLNAFQRDAGFPSAIMMEYLLDLLEMNCVTYSKTRMTQAVEGI